MPTPKDAPYKLAQQGNAAGAAKDPRRFAPVPKAQYASEAERIRNEKLRDVLVEWAAGRRPHRESKWWPELAPLTQGERAMVREYLRAKDAGEAP